MNIDIKNYNKKFKKDCLHVFNSNVGKFFAAWEVEVFEHFLSDLSSEKNTIPYFVFYHEKEIVACGGYEVKNGIGSLRWGMVQQSFHGKSIGKKLLKYRLDAMKKDSRLKKIEINTSHEAQGFYEKFGFKVTKVEKDGFKKGLDKVYMDYAIKK